MSCYLKTKCLIRIVEFKERNWDDCEGAWNALSDFAKPFIEEALPELKRRPIHAFCAATRHLSKSEALPRTHIQKLGLEASEIKYMFMSIFWEAKQKMTVAGNNESAVKSPEIPLAKRPRSATSADNDQDTTKSPPKSSAKRSRSFNPSGNNPETSIRPTTPSANRPRNLTSSSSNPNTTDKRAVKRTKPDNQGHRLMANAKIYFMQEGDQDSRTGVPILLLTKDKESKNNHIEIKSLYFAKVQQLLCKRTVYEKGTHEIFYYDLENRKVRIVVDNCNSFRTGIEEMAFHAGSNPKIEFLIREKSFIPRNTALATPSPTPKYTAEEPPRGPRAWTLPLQRKLDFRGNDRQYAA